jgi:CheY-specific phosphatase CheX
MRPTRELLASVVGGVLEDAAFVLATPREDAPPDVVSECAVCVRQAFRGPVTGHCEIRVPLDLAVILAANMLGMTSGGADAREICLDAMKEALNIICGSLLTEMAGEEPIFHLGTPEAQQGAEPPPTDDRTSQIWLDAEGHPILFCIRIDDGVSEAA